MSESKSTLPLVGAVAGGCAGAMPALLGAGKIFNKVAKNAVKKHGPNIFDVTKTLRPNANLMSVKGKAGKIVLALSVAGALAGAIGGYFGGKALEYNA